MYMDYYNVTQRGNIGMIKTVVLFGSLMRIRLFLPLLKVLNIISNWEYSIIVLQGKEVLFHQIEIYLSMDCKPI